MSTTSASKAYFERVAGEWDTLRAGYFTVEDPRQGETVREAAIAKAYLRPEMVVADVGSGTGFMVAGLAPLVSRVYALDGSPAMLEVARRNLGSFTNVVFQVADGQKLPLADGSVDAAFANMYLHHCPDPMAAIVEMVRVLRPGGRLVISDMEAHPHAWMRDEMADEWQGFELGQVKRWLREAGLVNVIVSRSGQSCCGRSQRPVDDPDDRNAAIGVFIATGSRRVAGAREAVQASYGALAASTTGCCSGQPAMNQLSCCSPDATEDVGVSSEVILFDLPYAAPELSTLPAEAAGLALGCGNPVAMATLRPGETVLDIGSGAGIDAFFAARQVGPAGRVIGLDMTPAMIERARQAAAAAGFDQVEFRLGQAEAMPVEDGTVDVILSNCVINLCEDKGRVFEEAYRVLKPGGRLAISDMVTDGPLPMSLRGDAIQWAGCVHGALPEREYLELVAQAGFRQIETRREKIGGELAGVQVYSLAVMARK